MNDTNDSGDAVPRRLLARIASGPRAIEVYATESWEGSPAILLAAINTRPIGQGRRREIHVRLLRRDAMRLLEALQRDVDEVFGVPDGGGGETESRACTVDPPPKRAPRPRDDAQPRPRGAPPASFVRAMGGS